MSHPSLAELSGGRESFGEGVRIDVVLVVELGHRVATLLLSLRFEPTTVGSRVVLGLIRWSTC